MSYTQLGELRRKYARGGAVVGSNARVAIERAIEHLNAGRHNQAISSLASSTGAMEMSEVQGVVRSLSKMAPPLKMAGGGQVPPQLAQALQAAKAAGPQDEEDVAAMQEAGALPPQEGQQGGDPVSQLLQKFAQVATEMGVPAQVQGNTLTLGGPNPGEEAAPVMRARGGPIRPHIQYKDSEDGARKALAAMGDKSMAKHFGGPDAKYYPDPSVNGVWGATAKNGKKAIIYLAGHKEPLGSVRKYNDFETDLDD